MDALRFCKPSEVTHGKPAGPKAGTTSNKLTSYVLSAESGESIVIPSSNSVLRIIADPSIGSGATLGLIGTRGTAAPPVPPHKHAASHDVWICLRGEVQLWAEAESRVLASGDFCLVPPGFTHTYEVLSPHCEFLGLATGAAPTGNGWVDFFRLVGDEVGSYKGPLYPTDDTRPFPVPRFIELLKSGLDIIPQRDYKTFPANPSSQKPDNALPSTPQPYFLKSDTGPRYLLAGQVVQPLTTPTLTRGQFGIAWLEASSCLPLTPLGPSASLRLRQVHTFVRVVEGSIDLTVEGVKDHLIGGEGGFIAAGDAFKLAYTSPYVRLLIFSASATSGGHLGLEGLYMACGQHYPAVKTIDENVDVDEGKVKQWVEANDAEMI